MQRTACSALSHSDHPPKSQGSLKTGLRSTTTRSDRTRSKLPPPPDDGRALYKRRGATVEPGIGNLKKIINRFTRRGIDNATSELHLAATAFNLMKVYRAQLA